MVGVLLTKQPFYIAGIEDYERAKGSAYGAAATFVVVFVVSMVYTIKEGRKLDRLTRSRIPYDATTASNGNGAYSDVRTSYNYEDDGILRDDEQELHLEFPDTLRVEHVDFHDDPLWENPLPTGRPYRDDPTFT